MTFQNADKLIKKLTKEMNRYIGKEIVKVMKK